MYDLDRHTTITKNANCQKVDHFRWSDEASQKPSWNSQAQRGTDWPARRCWFSAASEPRSRTGDYVHRRGACFQSRGYQACHRPSRRRLEEDDRGAREWSCCHYGCRSSVHNNHRWCETRRSRRHVFAVQVWPAGHQPEHLLLLPAAQPGHSEHVLGRGAAVRPAHCRLLLMLSEVPDWNLTHARETELNINCTERYKQRKYISTSNRIIFDYE